MIEGLIREIALLFCSNLQETSSYRLDNAPALIHWVKVYSLVSIIWYTQCDTQCVLHTHMPLHTTVSVVWVSTHTEYRSIYTFNIQFDILLYLWFSTYPTTKFIYPSLDIQTVRLDWWSERNLISEEEENN